MTSEIEEMKARVSQIEAELVEVQARLSDAQRDVARAERDERINRKLTPSMLGVLARLADGGILRRSTFKHPYRHRLTHSGEMLTVPSPVFDGLLEREAIAEYCTEGSWVTLYSITDHGRAKVQAAKGSE